MRKIVIALGLVVAFVATSCIPTQLDIDLTVRPGAVLDLRDPNRINVTLTGVVACSGGSIHPITGKQSSTGEPMDMSFKLSQADGAVMSNSEVTLRCSQEPRIYTLTWEDRSTVYGTVVEGPVNIQLDASTNPGGATTEDIRRDEASERVFEGGNLTILR